MFKLSQNSEYSSCPKFLSLFLTQFSSVQPLSPVRLYVTPWTATHQASLSTTNSWSLLKLMSIESVMPSNHLILCRPLLLLPQSFQASWSFLMSQFCESGDKSIVASASASALPMNIQGWFPLGLTGVISLQSKGLSTVFSNTTVQKHPFFGVLCCYYSPPISSPDHYKSSSFNLAHL